jgi:hypothetical protein
LDWKNYLVCIIKATQTKADTFHEDETSTGSMKITYAHVNNNEKTKYAIWQWNDMDKYEIPGYLSPTSEDAKHYTVGKEEKLYLSSLPCMH